MFLFLIDRQTSIAFVVFAVQVDRIFYLFIINKFHPQWLITL